MSAYVVLARKYRPQKFSELVGQDVLVQTLTNAIKNNRLHHGYILHGIRGVGKTTTARIIAKTLNCLNIKDQSQIEACGSCSNCVAIASSSHQDVFEFDAASRTGVDDVREIIDSIAYAPVLGKYKIYIIDEFHMMSDSAFNALLKTLEEPPANVKFIFATTEIHEVPKTILSRCQKFDLRRLEESEIFNHLKNILLKENFTADDQALNLIAKASEGSVRDSLSILDQALATNNHQQHLSVDIIEKMFGLSDRFKNIELLDFIIKGDIENAEKTFKKIYSISSDLIILAKDLLEIIHKISCLKLIKNYEIDSYSKLQIEKLTEIANNTEIIHLIRVWQLISKNLKDLDSASSAKIYFEMLMIKICHLMLIPDLKQVLLDLNSEKNHINSQQIEFNQTIKKTEIIDDDLAMQILKNFEGSKII
jgi:DNA polymerase-3 subunit gamma/tau